MKVAIVVCAFILSFAFAKEREGKDYTHLGQVHHPAPVAAHIHHVHPAPVVEYHHPAPVVEYHHPPAPKCHVKYEPKFVEKCKKIRRRPYKPCVEYRKEYQTKCYIQPKTCKPIVTTLPDEACHSQAEKHCTVEVKTTFDVSYQEKCEDIEHKICQQSQVVGGHKRPAVVGHPVVGHAAIGSPVFPASTIAIQARADPYYLNKHLHKREAESKDEPRDGKSYHPQPLPLLARGPSCQVKVERNCHKVPVKVPHHVEIPHCTRIPRKKCIPSFRTITDQVCRDEPKEVCREVEVEVPFDVPIEYCPPIVEEVCEKVPAGKTATEVCH